MAEPLPSLFSGMAQGIPQGAAMGQAASQMDMQRQQIVAAKQKQDEEMKFNKFTKGVELLKEKGLPKAFHQKIYSQVVVPAAKDLYGYDLDPNFPENGSEAAGKVSILIKKFQNREIGKGDFGTALADVLAESSGDKEVQDLVKNVADVTGVNQRPQEAPEGSYLVDPMFAQVQLKKAGMTPEQIQEVLQKYPRGISVRNLRAITSNGFNITFGGGGGAGADAVSGELGF